MLLQLYPLPPGVEVVPPNPEPRVSIADAKAASLAPEATSIPGYYTATIVGNTRITAPDWQQDVRHFDLEFDEDIEWVLLLQMFTSQLTSVNRYSPGDTAVISPIAPAEDVEAFLKCVGWLEDADKPFAVTHVLKDQSIPLQLPPIITLRSLFTRYLDINAVPRRSFFGLLRHFTDDEMEVEKLEDFLTPEGAVRVRVL